MNKQKVEIIPAVMPRNFAELEERVGQVIGVAPVVQIDIMDGVFVPNRGWPYTPQKRDMEGEPVENVFSGESFFPDFQKIVSEERGLPHWQNIDYELDLMISNVDETIDLWIATGARRLIFHLESLPLERMHAFLTQLRTRFPREVHADEADSGNANGTDANGTISANQPHHALEIGMAINVHTPPEKIERFIEQIDFVQCMGIDRIGFQGQDLAGGVIEQIRALREEYPWLIMSVDGGVNEHCVGMLVMEGVRRLVCGSAVFGQHNPAAAVRQLQAHFSEVKE